MTPELALEARSLLAAVPHRPLVLGTFGLVLHALLAPEHAADVDLLADIEHVPALVGVLLGAGFQVFSWQDPLTSAPGLEALRGRTYVRGDRRGLVVDVTYEDLDPVPWRSDAVVRDGISVASVARIVALKRKRGAEKDKRILALLGME